MPLVLGNNAIPGLYCSVEDVRAFGVPSTIMDDVITDAIQTADWIINNYVGTVFGNVSATFTINDVRKPLIVLPTPFTNVTGVTIDGVAFTTFTVEPWGIRLQKPGYFDPDGFPRWQLFPMPSASDYTVWGTQVIITATFGWSFVPLPVKRAAILLAARMATQNFSDLLPDSRISSLKVEDYSITLTDQLGSTWTTGDASVDRLLQPYVSMQAFIG